jgi:DNA-binding transcriptional ArsR family regulator
MLRNPRDALVEKARVSGAAFAVPCPELKSSVRKRTNISYYKHSLNIFPYENIFLFMPRAAITSDVFHAIAEPRRRELIGLLVNGKEHAVGELVLRLRMPQPAVSKHLGVLRRVGVVTVSRRGQLRLYRLNAKELKPVHDWVKAYERFWTHQLERIRQRAEQKVTSQLAIQLSKRVEEK